MNRFLLVTLLVACSPAQPEETEGCASLSDCDFGLVCDREVGECIEEPANRFVGSFRCEIEDSKAQGTDFGTSEVVGNVGNDRWSLNAAHCAQRSTNEILSIVFPSLYTEDAFWIFVDPAELSDRKASLGPAIGLGWARMLNDGTATVYGYSKSGRLELSSPPSIGKAVTGYLDITMYPAIDEEVLFGVPCPRGLVDCGSTTSDFGGAQVCMDLGNGLMCSRECAADGDCSRGDGVCVLGVCTKQCAANADCDAPLLCEPGAQGQSNGCF
jgi:hypothetical protein